MMEILARPFVVLALRLRILLDGLSAIVQAGLAVRAAPGTGLAEKAKAAAADPKVSRQGAAILRAFAPNIVLGRTFVTAYANTGTAIVARHDDVVDVLDRDADFEVVYEPRMRKLTGGANFFLGMQPGAAYVRDTSAMHIAMRHDDVPAVVAPLAARRAAGIVAAAPGRLDLPAALGLPVPTAIVTDYLGIDGAEEDLIDWASTMFWYLFLDLAADPAVETRTMAAAAKAREAIDASVARRKAEPGGTTVIDRCLALQGADTPGMDDLGIRNNLIGLLIGAIPTIGKACATALDQLLDRPGALRGARKAARDGDDGLLAAHVFEAMRFNPPNPLIYRRATRDTAIAAGALRGRRIPAGTMVMAVNHSAMFDRMRIADPESFRTDRPWSDYILWGYGLHTCFGAQINRAVVPAILKPLLARPNLRRAAGAAGRIDTDATPFPRHFTVEWD